MARPKKEINEDQVFKLAAINCSLAEMAAVLDCSEDTLGRRFADVIKKGRENGRMSLKRKQYETAMGGNVTMMIWLGKQLLDQKDISRIELSQVPDEVFQREAERRLNAAESSDIKKIS